MDTTHRAAAFAGTITPHFVFPTLLYADYENRSVQVASDTLAIPSGKLENVVSLLNEWQNQVEWRVFAGNEVAKPFKHKGDGVDLAQFLLSKSWKISLPTGSQVVEINQEQMENSLKRILPHLGTRSVMVVDINWQSIDIHAFKRMFRSNKPVWNYTHYDLDLSGDNVLFKYFNSVENRALLSKNMPDDEYHNMMMNLFTQLPARIKQERIVDIVRAAYTNILLKVFKQFPVNDFGLQQPLKSDEEADFPLVVLTGEVPAILNNLGVSLLMLLDGLQVSGMFYLQVDEDYRWRNLLAMNNEDFVLPLYSLFNDGIDLVIAHSLAFKLNAPLRMELRYKKNRREIEVPTDSIYRYDLSAIRRVVFKDKALPEEVKSSEVKKRLRIGNWRSLIVDLRKTPVKYGPNIENNMVKIPGWIESFNRVYDPAQS